MQKPNLGIRLLRLPVVFQRLPVARNLVTFYSLTSKIETESPFLGRDYGHRCVPRCISKYGDKYHDVEFEEISIITRKAESKHHA